MNFPKTKPAKRDTGELECVFEALPEFIKLKSKVSGCRSSREKNDN
jgi:hypothetical protein